jgi:histidyl-tRNA synthetase
MMRRNWVIDQIQKTYDAYGFEPLGTPAFESWDLLKVKSGEDIIDQIYYFRDKSERELGLRFEWTASLARVVSSHRELGMPFKRYAIGPVWRYERPSETRFREFWQADADIVGVENSIADAEVLSVAVNCLKRLGFKDFLIRINDRRIMETIVENVGIAKTKALDVFRTVDKLDKIGKEGVIEELSEIVEHPELSEKLLERLSVQGNSGSTLEKAKELTGNSRRGIEGFEFLSSLLHHGEAFGFTEFVEIDLTLARGLDYYTGPVFEISAKGYESYGSIAGGGRYDEIIELFGGQPTPAVGISFGLERLVTLLEDIGAFENLDLGVKVFIAIVTESVRGEAIKIAQNLRSRNISTEVNLLDRSLSNQFDHANRKGVDLVVIVGPKEVETNLLTVRDMRSGKEEKINSTNLIEFILEKLNQV